MPRAAILNAARMSTSRGPYTAGGLTTRYWSPEAETISSAASFDRPYALIGAGTSVSFTGRLSVAGPAAERLEQKTRSASGATRCIDSTMLRVPSTLTTVYAASSAAEVRPARWNTTETERTARSRSSPGVSISPFISVTSSVGSHLSLLVFLTRQRTRQSRGTSASTRCPPMKPDAPVTSATRRRAVTLRCCEREVVHAIHPVDLRAHFLEWRAHHHVVLENPRELRVDDPARGTVLQHLELHELGNSRPPVFIENPENHDSRCFDLSRIPE